MVSRFALFWQQPPAASAFPPPPSIIHRQWSPSIINHPIILTRSDRPTYGRLCLRHSTLSASPALPKTPSPPGRQERREAHHAGLKKRGLRSRTSRHPGSLALRLHGNRIMDAQNLFTSSPLFRPHQHASAPPASSPTQAVPLKLTPPCNFSLSRPVSPSPRTTRPGNQ